MGAENVESKKPETPEIIDQSNQSGGVNFLGGSTQITGDVTGRDKTVYSMDQGMSDEALQQMFLPLIQSLKEAPPEKKTEAEEKVNNLKAELSKGEKADDSRVAKLIDGIIGLVPGAISAVVGMFGNPLLGGLVGPVTKFVLDQISGK